MDTTRKRSAKIYITKFIEKICPKMQNKSGQSTEEAPDE
jgi:hypothetical protein